MKFTVPIATRGGNRLLLLKGFFADQVPVSRGTSTGKGTNISLGVPPSPQTSAPSPEPRASWAFSGQRRRDDRVWDAESASAGGEAGCVCPRAGEHVL